MQTAEIRRQFLSFFQGHGHAIVPSSSLVPHGDATLLFTNAGMVQFKDVFLGLEKRDYTRAASVQRCVRAGGKHNDLENVGYTARHHTFFEMLGNFSFGDYFKREAIEFAWSLLTDKLALAPEKLWITVHSQDDEAADVWLKTIGVSPRRFSRIDSDDNFWSMGDTGPCGPCTEIFYDHGPQVPGGPPGTPDADGDRYVEIWNLVFMQYNRGADGAMGPLPRPSVDTGMGLERLAAVLQGVHSNYEIDLFQDLIRAAAGAVGVKPSADHSLRVIADHIRSCAFLVVDGVIPSNEGRGYVLRRIIRRAIRHGHRLGAREPFFHALVAPLVAQMGEAYPELVRGAARAEEVLRLEELRFAETLEQGLRILRQEISGAAGGVLPGELVFRLYDTYGFPVDLTADVAREQNLQLDMAGYERAMDAQRARARAASRFEAEYASAGALEGSTEFTGYDRLEEEARISALFADGKPVESLAAGMRGAVILERTPFYAESGGQVGDRGVLRSGEALFEVEDTQRMGEGNNAHLGRLRLGALRVGDRVRAQVDADARAATARNHSATHLLHAALRGVLGAHVEQKGSLVEPGRLRFDFTHFEPVKPAQIEAIEREVNAVIRANAPVVTEVMDLEAARAAGAVALFGEKYGARVRVVAMGAGYSMELCGGTHVHRAGDVGLLKIIAESGIAAGVRRIEAVTGAAAWDLVAAEWARGTRLADQLRCGRDEVEDRVKQLLDRTRQLERDVERLQARLGHAASGELAARHRQVGPARVLAEAVDGVDPKALRNMVDQLKQTLAPAVIVLATVADGKVALVCGVSDGLAGQVHAGKLANLVAGHVGGKGGGRPDMAQAGGGDPSGLAAGLAAAYQEVEQLLAD